jgi:formylglycine-generating enzyme required for sulfatase activity
MGGYTLEQHARDRQTQEKLEGGGWDFVVLQESTQVLTVESARDAQMAPAVGALEEKARAQGAQTVLVLMWASTRAVDEAGLAQFASQQAEVTAALQQMVQGLDVLLAPVGPAWERSLRQRPELGLWGSDNHHASPAGTYLMACVLYATIYQQSPVGLSFTAGLPEETAQFLQEIAERASDQPTTPPISDGPPAIASLYDTWIRPVDEMVMIYVPGGTFLMGSGTGETDAADDEFPQHPVTLDGFWMDRTEVTNAQYALCVADADCAVPPYAGDAGFNGDNYPVVGVSWDDAADYCAWAGARLPTEAEWEYAARGTRGFIYPWGDDFDCSRGNFDDETEMDEYVGPGGEGCDGYVRTSPAGSFPTGASWCGALDMAGNVWEWVADWDGNYPSAAQTNPTGPTSGDRKILRGGSFNYGPSYVRTADRSRHHPDGRSARGGYVGFRCVVAAPRE